MRKVILYTAVSIDGYIARENGDIDWLPSENSSTEDVGYELFYDRIDVTLMGRKTYEQILTFPCEFPYKTKLNYVFTYDPKWKSTEFVRFVTDEPHSFVSQLKQLPGKSIWLVGGGKLNQTLLNHGLIDELIITIIPIIIGSGIHLFAGQSIEQKFKLEEAKALPGGFVQMRYTI